MKEYTPENPVWHESQHITEPTDNAHADIINRGPKEAFDNTILLKKQIDNIGGVSIVIPTTGWTNGEDDETEEMIMEGLHVDLSVENVTENMIPLLNVVAEDMGIAAESGINAVQTFDGIVRIFGTSVPTQEIHASLSLLGS